jgi:hypothetical protein
MMDGSQEVAADPKEILHGAVHREKPLRVRGGRKTPHHLTLPDGWLVMRLLCHRGRDPAALALEYPAVRLGCATWAA